jgi:type VI secretion system protein ImpB
VNNTLKDDGSEMAVQLKFRSMEDFEPGKIAEAVPALKKLLETRNQLRDLATKADLSPELEGLLERVLQNEDDLKQLSEQLGLGKSGEGE